MLKKKEAERYEELRRDALDALARCTLSSGRSLHRRQSAFGDPLLLPPGGPACLNIKSTFQPGKRRRHLPLVVSCSLFEPLAFESTSTWPSQRFTEHITASINTITIITNHTSPGTMRYALASLALAAVVAANPVQQARRSECSSSYTGTFEIEVVNKTTPTKRMAFEKVSLR